MDGQRFRPTRLTWSSWQSTGRPPISVLRVTVEEAFLHCAKALIRARIWEADAKVDRSRFPTCGQVLADRIAGADAAEIDAGEAESARTELY